LALENRHLGNETSREPLRHQNFIDHGSGFPELPEGLCRGSFFIPATSLSPWLVIP
jgi:hypothetical protein